MKKIFTSREVGRLLNADPTSVNRWVDTGKLKGHRTPGGHRRIRADDLLTFVKEFDMPMPDELRLTSHELLVIDEDEKNRKQMRQSLTRLAPQWEVNTAGSMIEAMMHIGQHTPDVLLVDLRSAGPSPADVCKQIKSIPAGEKIVLIGYGEQLSQAREKQLREAGMEVVLSQPWRSKDLLEVLNRHVHEASS